MYRMDSKFSPQSIYSCMICVGTENKKCLSFNLAKAGLDLNHLIRGSSWPPIESTTYERFIAMTYKQ